MTFIFTPAGDPRGESVSELKAGDRAKYRGMTMPAEIISGPHKSPGRDRYLIRKADGNVSLVPTTDLERVVPRIDQVAGTLAINVFGVPFKALPLRDQMRMANAARNALSIADRTRGQA